MNGQRDQKEEKESVVPSTDAVVHLAREKEKREGERERENEIEISKHEFDSIKSNKLIGERAEY